MYVYIFVFILGYSNRRQIFPQHRDAQHASLHQIKICAAAVLRIQQNYQLHNTSVQSVAERLYSTKNCKCMRIVYVCRAIVGGLKSEHYVCFMCAPNDMPRGMNFYILFYYKNSFTDNLYMYVFTMICALLYTYYV